MWNQCKQQKHCLTIVTHVHISLCGICVSARNTWIHLRCLSVCVRTKSHLCKAHIVQYGVCPLECAEKQTANTNTLTIQLRHYRTSFCTHTHTHVDMHLSRPHPGVIISYAHRAQRASAASRSHFQPRLHLAPALPPRLAGSSR